MSDMPDKKLLSFNELFSVLTFQYELNLDNWRSISIKIITSPQVVNGYHAVIENCYAPFLL